MAGLSQWIHRLSSGAWGFSMNEVMSGEHVFAPGMGPPGKQPLEFRVRWGPENLANWLDRSSPGFLINKLEGSITAGGLCAQTPCQGTLELRYFSDHKLRYDFRFVIEGDSYRFVGEKVNVRPWNLPVSHTTCFGTIVEEKTGRLVSRSVTYFRMSTVPAFLASWRPTV